MSDRKPWLPTLKISKTYLGDTVQFMRHGIKLLQSEPTTPRVINEMERWRCILFKCSYCYIISELN